MINERDSWADTPMGVVFVVNVPTTAKVIRGRDHGLKSHLTDWWSRKSNMRSLVYKASGLSTTPQRLLSSGRSGLKYLLKCLWEIIGWHSSGRSDLKCSYEIDKWLTLLGGNDEIDHWLTLQMGEVIWNVLWERPLADTLVGEVIWNVPMR